MPKTAKEQIEAALGIESVSWNLKRLFMAEILYDLEQGTAGSMLYSAMETLQGGHEPIPGFDSDNVKRELKALIEKYGERHTLASFLSKKDWDRRSKEPESS